jgi:hypothetical protein
MITWGVGSIPLNVQAKVERDEDLAVVIQMTWTKYVKGFKGVWMECNYKFAFNKMVWREKIDLFMQYHESKMIHGL